MADLLAVMKAQLKVVVTVASLDNMKVEKMAGRLVAM